MERYKYEGLLDNVWLVSGFSKKDTPYGSATVVEDVHALGVGVLAAVLKQPARLNGGAVAYLRTKLDITQAECAISLGVREQTVSLWERGRHSIPLAEDVLLRSLVIERLDQAELNLLGRISVNDLTKFAARLDSPSIVFARENFAWHHSYEYSVCHTISGVYYGTARPVVDVVHGTSVGAVLLDSAGQDLFAVDSKMQFISQALNEAMVATVALFESSVTAEFDDAASALPMNTVTADVNLKHTYH